MRLKNMGPVAVRVLAGLAMIVLQAGAVAAAEATIAVAGNFYGPLETLAGKFSRVSPHTLRLTSGSTGALYAQITHGAPFDILLAADQERPRLLVEKGLAVNGSRFTYAVGRLVLWSRDPMPLIDDGEKILRGGGFQRLALANPKLAPYGSAALEVLAHLGMADAIAGKLVYGQNVSQAFQFVKTGNAELGLLALSQMADVRMAKYWTVPSTMHAPIRQDAVLLNRGRENAAAIAFLEFLRSYGARSILTAFGYETGLRR